MEKIGVTIRGLDDNSTSIRMSIFAATLLTIVDEEYKRLGGGGLLVRDVSEQVRAEDSLMPAINQARRELFFCLQPANGSDDESFMKRIFDLLATTTTNVELRWMK
jgi:hypothetical protein